MHISDRESPWLISSNNLEALLADDNGVAIANTPTHTQMIEANTTMVEAKTNGSNAGTRKRVAVIGLTGAITKYGNWYTPGMVDYADYMHELDQDASVAGTVLMVDSPGGSATGMFHMVEEMAKRNKPIVIVVDGQAASAAMGISAAADKIMLLNEKSQVGSIGTIISFVSMKGYYEKQGAKVIEVYASRSIDKNKDLRDAEKGDMTALQALTDKYNDIFIADVARNRGLDAEKSPVFTGKMYWGQEAISVGLADGIGGIPEAIQEVLRLSEASEGTNTQNTNTEIINQKPDSMKFKAMWTALIALFAFSAAKPEETEVTDEHLAKIDETITSLTASLKVAEEKVTALTSQVATLTTENTELKAKSQPIITTKGADAPIDTNTDSDWNNEFSGKIGTLAKKYL